MGDAEVERRKMEHQRFVYEGKFGIFFYCLDFYQLRDHINL